MLPYTIMLFSPTPLLIFWELFFAALELLLLFGLGVRAQEFCSDGDALEAHLKAAPTCEKAAAMMKDCSWGSSADSGFSRIVVDKCEATFLKQLSPDATKRYRQEMDICWKTEELQMGTMYISFSALCQVDIVEGYATSPARRSDPPLQASFDCKKASSPLERAICSDPALGEEDVILSRIYKRVTNDLKSDPSGPVLREDQRAWLQKLPGVCKVSEPVTQAALQCLRQEVKVRYSLIGGCFDGDDKDKQQLRSCLRDRSGLRGYGDNPK